MLHVSVSLRDRRLRALEELHQPPKPRTNAAAAQALGPLARACEWDPEADRPARMRGRFHALASIVMGEGERRLRVCKHCLHRTAARHYARVVALQPGRAFQEAKKGGIQ